MIATTEQGGMIERFAIRCALGNNGGDWASHYTEEQKQHWRQFVVDLCADMHIEAARLEDELYAAQNDLQSATYYAD